MNVIVVGAGPAGMRAAQTLVAAGVRPVVIDEGDRAGGQIYRRPPDGFVRDADTLYGADAPKARDLHDMFDGLRDSIEYRPATLAWNVAGDVLHIVSGGVAEALPFDALILATGATDRLLPIAGWTLPGCYSLGGAQVALKAQGCAIGRRVVFMGTGPLLYLVAHQYRKAGVDIAAVLDTSPLSAQLRALPDLAVRPGFLLRGAKFRAGLQAAGVRVENAARPIAIEGDGEVAGVRYRVGDAERHVAADAVAVGFHLRSETQLADLARAVADDVILCRCECVTVGELRETATAKDAPEMNRTKALSRIGMGRCQGRYCGSAAAEILAEVRGVPVAQVGRLRGQAPVKPLSMGTAKGASS